MATQITQIKDDERGVYVLRVEGDMFRSDAVLLEKIATELHESERRPIVLDVADLDLIDSEAAPILRQLLARDGFEIDGVEYFLQAMIDQAERR